MRQQGGSRILSVLTGVVFAAAAIVALADELPQDVFRTVRVEHTVVEDNGDGDGWADSNETVTVRLRVRNASPFVRST